MAVPHVSGALARIWADFPNCKSDVVRKSIQESAKDLGPPGKDSMFGYGLLQAEAAYNWLSRQPCAAAGFTEERGQKQQVAEQKQQDQGQQKPQQEAAKQQQPESPKQQSPGSSPKAGGQQGQGAQQAPRNLIHQMQPALGSRQAFSDWLPGNTRQ